MDAVGIVDGVAAYLVGLVALLQNVTTHVLHYNVGPFAAAVVFAMIVSILFNVAQDLESGAAKKIILYIFYLVIIFGLLVGTLQDVVDADAGGSTLEVGSRLSLALTVLLLLLGTIAITAIMMFRRAHGAAIQVALLIGSLVLQYWLANWQMTIEAWLIISLVAVLFVLIVR
jgi:hypothetical protein